MATDLTRFGEKTTSFHLPYGYSLRNGVASSEDELRTALILLTDLSYQARSWSREINIIDFDLIPEAGIE